MFLFQQQHRILVNNRILALESGCPGSQVQAQLFRIPLCLRLLSTEQGYWWS